MDAEIDIETFYAKAPRLQPNASLIKASVRRLESRRVRLRGLEIDVTALVKKRQCAEPAKGIRLLSQTKPGICACGQGGACYYARDNQ
jgi:hypothetical protein